MPAQVSGVTWVENTPGTRAFLEADPQLYATLTAAAQRGVAYARSIAPVDTGAYRDSIRVEPAENDIGLVFFSDDRKAHWIEFGAAHTRRYRVLGQAIDRIRV